jgi:hypothetical protein
MFVAVSQLFDAATTAWLLDYAAFTPSPLRTSFFSILPSAQDFLFLFLRGRVHTKANWWLVTAMRSLATKRAHCQWSEFAPGNKGKDFCRRQVPT